MQGLNKVLLMGRLGRDPETKNANGIAITNFSVATSKSWRDEAGEKKEKTEWHNVVCFRKTAEIAAKFLAKGSSVFIEGELQTRSWEDEKTGAKKYKTEIIAHGLQFLDGPKDSQKTDASARGFAYGSFEKFETDEDLPF